MYNIYRYIYIYVSFLWGTPSLVQNSEQSASFVFTWLCPRGPFPNESKQFCFVSNDSVLLFECCFWGGENIFFPNGVGFRDLGFVYMFVNGLYGIKVYCIPYKAYHNSKIACDDKDNDAHDGRTQHTNIQNMQGDI